MYGYYMHIESSRYNVNVLATNQGNCSESILYTLQISKKSAVRGLKTILLQGSWKQFHSGQAIPKNKSMKF